MVGGKPESLVLRVVPSCAQPEHESSARHRVQRRSHVRDHGRAPKRAAENKRSELHPRGHGGDGAEQRPGVVHPVDGAVRHPCQEVVRDPHRVETRRLGRLRDRADVAPRRRAAARPVHIADRQHYAHFHGGHSTGQSPRASLSGALSAGQASPVLLHGPTSRKKMLPGSVPRGWPKNAPKSFPADASPS